MDPKSVVINCAQNGSWLFTIVWGAALPLFAAYLASAAYAFQRRRADIEVAHKAMKDMRALTKLALDRLAGLKVDPEAVKEHGMDLISRIRLELLNRPSDVQSLIHKSLVAFLTNADVADGSKTDTPKEVLARQVKAEDEMINLIRQLTVVEALRQAWSNPGINESFTSLMERYIK